jgi:predicted ATPase
MRPNKQANLITAMETAGDQHCKAEVYRLQGELLQRVEDRAQRADVTPEACFRQALDIARRQEAKSFELRAAISLARLWRQQDKRREAYDLLAPVYGWFSEGFDTADLKDAKVLLDELSAESRPPTR